MTKQYFEFAYLYDRLMTDVDYQLWANFIEKMLEIKNAPILELACGTGNITIPMALKGYEMIGVDLSEDMLMVAKEKAISNNLDILFLQQDMANLKLDTSYNNIICTCDGVNYIIDEVKLMKMFEDVYRHLSEDGVFIFDISSQYKLKTIIGNNTYGENQGDLCYLWENFFDDNTNIIEMDLTFFIQEGKLYKKFEEYHKQRAYSKKEILSALKAVGFNKINIYSDFMLKEPTADSQRIFFKCRK